MNYTIKYEMITGGTGEIGQANTITECKEIRSQQRGTRNRWAFIVRNSDGQIIDWRTKN